MGITRTEEGWKVDTRPAGRNGKRYRKTFTRKADAIKYEAYLKTQHTQNPEWEGPKKDKRKLSALVKKWHELHGRNLKDGEKRKTKLERITKDLDNPVGSEMKAGDFTKYRAKRLKEGRSPNTVNHDLAYLRALFNELERLGEWNHENPIAKVRRLKHDETELTFLTSEEITKLLTALDDCRNKDAKRITMLCLATGARWSEAETLRAEQVSPYRVSYWGTKNGKGRAVPISKELYETIAIKKRGRLFKSSYEAFTNAVNQSGLELPKGQRTHILRHTFASHFMMNGGNILALQRILGHANLTMTMRYAHLAPEHLEEAARLNPLAKI